MKRFFITGTDTEVGKTVASGALLQAAATAGFRCAAISRLRRAVR